MRRPTKLSVTESAAFPSMGPPPPTSSVTRLVMRRRHTRAAVTPGKGGGGPRLQKALLSVTVRESAQLWGFRLLGKWGVTGSADFRNGTRICKKPFDVAIFGRQG